LKGFFAMKHDSPGFTRKDVARLLELRPSQVQYYTDQGIVVPEISAPAGKGTRRVYSKRNFLQILITKRLVENGVPLGEAKGIIEAFEDQCKQLQSTAKEMEGLKNFPRGEASRWKEKSRVAKMLWEVSSWDNAYDLFICIHRKDKQPIRLLVWPLAKGRDSMKIEEEISRETVSIIVLNITDLMEKVVKP
jgi:DNA-binding transcriptional MerR regulator